MPLLEVGRVVKAHGVRGDVIVDLITHRTERLAAGSVLALDERGSRSLVVSMSRPDRAMFLVHFEGVDDRTAADGLRGARLMAEALDDEPDALWVHELIGATVLDTSANQLGRVAAVEANPASDLLVLDGGGLIPMRFVVDHDRDTDRVTVEIPHGLLDP